MLEESTLSGMDLVVYRYVIPNSATANCPEGEFVQDVVYDNQITEADLREWIAYRHGHKPAKIEIAR
jgi:hypothetical protein